jgi:hypothetical protein
MKRARLRLLEDTPDEYGLYPLCTARPTLNDRRTMHGQPLRVGPDDPRRIV